MTDEDLKRMLGMNAPLETLSVRDIEALTDRVKDLTPDSKLQVEAILLRDLGSTPDLARTILQRLSNKEPDSDPAHPSEALRLQLIKILALVFIAIHSFAVTLVLIRLLHR